MIDGNTLVFATAGNPVTQVRPPQVMEVVFGLDYPDERTVIDLCSRA